MKSGGWVASHKRTHMEHLKFAGKVFLALVAIKVALNAVGGVVPAAVKPYVPTL